jgi:hypothetical protein
MSEYRIGREIGFAFDILSLRHLLSNKVEMSSADGGSKISKAGTQGRDLS